MAFAVRRPAGERVAFDATMYFSYGRSRRDGVLSTTTFDAICAGERSSTTRFHTWAGTERWANAKPGDIARFWSDKERRDRSVLVRILSTEEIDLATCSDERLEDWSRCEGWSPAAGRDFGRRNGRGVQVRFELA